MNTILLVTGNAHKLEEWQNSMPHNITLESIDLDLPELQSDDPLEIVTDKVKKAYEIVGKPVIIEDVSAGLSEMKGLPGPFIKFFIKTLGPDALYQLSNRTEGATAIVSCSAAYYDGSQIISVRGDVHGTVVSPRGAASFGFDPTFIPDGHTQTYAEMDVSLKNSVSHRAHAITLLLAALKDRGVITN